MPVGNAISKRYCLLKTLLFQIIRLSMISWIASPQAWTLNNVNQQFNHKLTFTLKWPASMLKTQDSSKLPIPLKEVSRILIQIPSRARWKLYSHQDIQKKVEGAAILPLKAWRPYMTKRVLKRIKILLSLNQEFSGTLKIMRIRGANKLNMKISSSLRILRNPSTFSAKST